ncbi:hypothetical protein Mp_2g08540 [Marchantia polymorpha subsp. ruderalis]|uniref:Protein phosphatase inhibitor 2 n=1 Tax=Marchantia polymorpha TaxID=3197 RepID=A0A2R6XGX8_MARPO|nr:hypothetical protein MARPO_0015s0139 [Marchantia polymorpha]BBN01577.1 hypothetical protein Mp_2g08540 [Marchantia polymorpha subsp. ruderalis]|eukprot:PTQ45344.1 hypothetical protein MARPO_0015s0139 [Marchantia polymorpha]
MKRTGSHGKHLGVRVVWDEENLDYLEAHKTPKQKIDEPKTPYHPPGAEDNIVSPTPLENALHADAIRLALSQVASTTDDRYYNDGEGASSSSSSGAGPSTSSPVAQCRFPPYDRETKSIDFDEPPSKPRRHKSFEEKRHMHHLEYRRAKSMLSNQPMIEEDENEYRDQASGSCSSTNTLHSKVRKTGITDAALLSDLDLSSHDSTPLL